MKKVLGILGVLIVVVVLTSVLNPNFVTAYNLQNILQRTALYGILGIGVAFVIMSGGIDLSIGSVVGLVGCLVPILIMQQRWPVALVVMAVFAVTAAIGLAHGLLITKLRLQPFVVTLCGLLLYRGVARWVTDDQSQGFGAEHEELRRIAVGKLPLTGTFALPAPFLILLVVAGMAHLFLNR